MGIFAVGLYLLATLEQISAPKELIWRMAVCGIGIGLFQTPNNVTITTSAPIQRSGGASGMLGTARVLGQTLGTAMVAVLFHLKGNQGGEVICLWVALGLALLSAVLSGSRLKEDSPVTKKK